MTGDASPPPPTPSAPPPIVAPELGDLDPAARVPDHPIVAEVIATHVESHYGVMGRAGVEAIWSDVTFVPLRIWRDREQRFASSGFTVRVLGGCVGDVCMRVSETPEIVRDERAIVFLDPGAGELARWGNGSLYLPVERLAPGAAASPERRVASSVATLSAVRGRVRPIRTDRDTIADAIRAGDVERLRTILDRRVGLTVSVPTNGGVK